jgi:hypothetical protein
MEVYGGVARTTTSWELVYRVQATTNPPSTSMTSNGVVMRGDINVVHAAMGLGPVEELVHPASTLTSYRYTPPRSPVPLVNCPGLATTMVDPSMVNRTPRVKLDPVVPAGGGTGVWHHRDTASHTSAATCAGPTN